MCQCMICGCWWLNYCGVCCGGCHEANLIYSWWLCKPEDLRLLDPVCCHICACDGLGYNCLWEGSICCAPKAIVEWSGLRAAGKTAADLNSGKTIIINNTAPSPVYMQQPGMEYKMTTTTRTNSNGMNMNMGMGGVGMNVNMNNGMNGNMGYEMNTNVGMGGNVNMGMGGGNMNMGMGGGNMNMGMGGGNMNMGMNPNMNYNANVNMNTPGVNAKVSF